GTMIDAAAVSSGTASRCGGMIGGGRTNPGGQRERLFWASCAQEAHCPAAADHCADQAGGRTGHRRSDQSSPVDRLSRYGIWARLWGEIIPYGKTTARAIVLTLIIDYGRLGRPHRKNIFNPSFRYADAAYGPHALYGSVCTINFASG